MKPEHIQHTHQFKIRRAGKENKIGARSVAWNVWDGADLEAEHGSLQSNTTPLKIKMERRSVY